MKKLLILLFSLFLLSSPSVFADDISDFEIEGISIGDSLLDYMTEDEILKEIEIRKDWYSFLKEPSKYSHIYLLKDFLIYDEVSFFIKNNSTNKYLTNKSEKYKILLLAGSIDYIEDIDGCMKERDEVAEIISDMFPNSSKEEYSYSHGADPSGKSMKYDVIFQHDSGAEIEVSCDNFEENYRIKNNSTEGLNLSISTAETTNWLMSNK